MSCLGVMVGNFSTIRNIGFDVVNWDFVVLRSGHKIRPALKTILTDSYTGIYIVGEENISFKLF